MPTIQADDGQGGTVEIDNTFRCLDCGNECDTLADVRAHVDQNPGHKYAAVYK